MKHTLGKALALATLTLAVNTAMAADSVDVKVIGTIVPTACKPEIAGGSTIDYGTIKASDIVLDDYTVLPRKTVDFTITCDAPAKVALKTIDVKSDSMVRPIGKNILTVVVTETTPLQGLGMDGTSKIGAYRMLLSGVTVDGGTSVKNLLSADGGKSWSKPVYLWLSPDYIASVGAAAGDNTPLAFTTLSGTFQLQAAINKGSELDLTKAVHLDGQSTVELYYL